MHSHKHHHQHEHRTFFPFILIGLTVLLALFIVAITRDSSPESNVQTSSSSQSVVNMVSEEEYQRLTSEILRDYESNKDVERAYQSLLDIVLPPTYKEVHLELVIIMSKFDSGQTDEAQARLDVLRQQYSWLAM